MTKAFHGFVKKLGPCPIPSMYGIFTYIWHKNQPNVGKYTIHGPMGVCVYFVGLSSCHLINLIFYKKCPAKCPRAKFKGVAKISFCWGK